MIQKKHDLTNNLRILYICGAFPDRTTLAHLERLIDSGVTSVQLRLKEATGAALYEAAVQYAGFCRKRKIPFFINDRLDVALACGADGVHLGGSDLPVAAARKIAPAGFFIGATARDAATAKQAQTDGADYIGCGGAFPSSTKLDTTTIGPSGIEAVTAAVSIPVIGIGGIDAANILHLSGCGLVGVALGNALREDAGIRNAQIISQFILEGALQR